jgi:hypothetical protein
MLKGVGGFREQLLAIATLCFDLHFELECKAAVERAELVGY